MRATRAALVVLVGALCGAGAASAQDVKTDYDHDADFTKYKTFITGVESQWGDPLAEKRVIAAVDSALSSKGWSKGTSQDSVDVLVVVHGASKNQKQLNTFYDGMGWGAWGWRGGGAGGMASTTVSEYQVGTLLVDMFDRTTKQMIWRGSASDGVSGKADKNTQKIYKATAKMFKDFPPKAGASH